MRLGIRVGIGVLISAALLVAPVSLFYFDAYPMNTTPANSNGSLNIYVHDAPPSSQQVTGVWITFTAVSIHGVSTGWLNNQVTPSRTINISGLTTTTAKLLQTYTLQPGKYTMLRLYLLNVSVILGGVNTTFRLSASFAFINGPFNISGSQTTTINIDFNLTQCLNMHAEIFTPKVGYTIS